MQKKKHQKIEYTFFSLLQITLLLYLSKIFAGMVFLHQTLILSSMKADFFMNTDTHTLGNNFS